MNKTIDAIKIPARVYETLEKNDSMGLHSHASIELIYIIDGICNLQFKPDASQINEIYLSPGQYALVAPGILHRWESGPIHYIVLEFMTVKPTMGILEYLRRSDYLRQFAMSADFLCNFNGIYLLNDTQDILATLKKLLSLLSKEDNGRDDFYEASYALYLKFLAILILQSKKEDLFIESGNRYIKQAHFYFEKNYKNKITLGTLAAHLNLSCMHVERIFKYTYGTTAIKKLNEFRTEKVKQLLKSTNYTLKDIANLVGYGSEKVLLDNFVKFTGYTPSKFKREILENQYSIVDVTEKYALKIVDLGANG